MFERIRHRVTTIHADRQTLVAEAGTTAMGRSATVADRPLAVFQGRVPGQKTLPYRPSYIQLIQLQLPALRSQTLKPA